MGMALGARPQATVPPLLRLCQGPLAGLRRGAHTEESSEQGKAELRQLAMPYPSLAPFSLFFPCLI